METKTMVKLLDDASIMYVETNTDVVANTKPLQKGLTQNDDLKTEQLDAVLGEDRKKVIIPVDYLKWAVKIFDKVSESVTLEINNDVPIKMSSVNGEVVIFIAPRMEV